jgi:putative cardiolipin synthase
VKHKLTFFGLCGLGSIAVIFLIYVLATAWLPFFHKGKTSDTYRQQHPVERFFGDDSRWGNDRIALLDDPVAAGRWRLQMIAQAQESIVISYYTLIPGVYADLFFGALFAAADRGVHVRFICDALVGGMKGQLLDIRKAMETHPNMEIGLYEPLNIFKPWEWNNRLHDKFLVVDGKVAIMGGRNIGDKLYQPSSYDGEPVFDRDVLIYRTALDEPSVIDEILAYSELLWNLPFMEHGRNRTSAGISRGETIRGKWAAKEERQRAAHPEFFTPTVEDWMEVTMPTRKITLVHNPMGRWSKEPWIWDELVRLFDTAQHRVLIQSPYIVPLRNQIEELQSISDKGVQLTYLTNSAYSTPNIPGFSGYLRQKNRILKTGPIYEYMGPGSIHAKSALVDDRFSVVGSFNLDPRSLHLDTETMLVIDSEPFNEHLDGIMDLWLDASARNEAGQPVIPPANPQLQLHRAGFFKTIILRVAQIVLWPINMLV